jgi:hypothetical protein
MYDQEVKPKTACMLYSVSVHVMLVTIGNIAFAIQVSFIIKQFITFSMCLLSKGKVNISERLLCLILWYNTCILFFYMNMNL